MKQITVLILTILLMATVVAFAETKDDPIFAPILSDIIARGNAFTSSAHGYGALFTNPAGFSKADGSFTLLSANLNPYFAPNQDNIDGFITAFDDPKGSIDLLSQVIVDNGIGANANTGVAIVGKGLGLAIIVDADSYGRGKTALSPEVDVAGTAAAIAGLSYNLKLGPFSIHVGGDLRYMHRIKMDNVPIPDLVSLSDGGTPSIDVLTGDGLAIDLGTIVDFGPLSFGLSIRDVGGTKFIYTSKLASDYMDESVDSVSVNDDYRIPMSVNTGIGYHPDFGMLKWLIDPTFNIDYQHVLYADSENTPSFWTELHAGTEIKVLRFLKVRAGINQGYITAGIGAKLLFFDVNMAYFTREMGEYAGVDPNSGMSLEVAIRF